LYKYAHTSSAARAEIQTEWIQTSTPLHSTLCLYGTYGNFPFSSKLPNRLADLKAVGFNVEVK